MGFVLPFYIGLGLSFLLPGHPVASSKSKEGVIVLEVRNVRSSKGSVAVLLFDNPMGFPKVPAHAVKSWKFSLGKSHQFTLSGIPIGKYALSVIHDENQNGRLDTNVLGVPQEGYGFSNNPKARFGSPDFQEAAFVVQENTTPLSLELIHWTIHK